MISIIVPVFNVEGKLKQILDSILGQSYQKFECILIDDGSIDSSYDICKDYEKKDVRVRCFTQENHGVSFARNRGMELARGEFITFLDADDFIPSNYLKELIQCCENGDVAICDIVVIDNGEEKFRFTARESRLGQMDAINDLLSRKYISSGPYGKMYRKEVIANLTFPYLKTYEDILFVLDVFSNAKTIVTTNQTQYYYIQNENGAMSKMMKTPSLDIVIASEKLLQYIVQRHDLSPECCYVTISHLFQYVISIINSNNYKNSEFIDKTRKLLRKYIRLIFSCKAIPWKEKIVFYLFVHGIVLQSGKRMTRIRKE